MLIVPAIDLGSIGLDVGARLLLERALAFSAEVVVHGTHPDLRDQLHAWALCNHHAFDPGTMTLCRGNIGRWVKAVRAGKADGISLRASSDWGLAPRGSRVEAGTAPIPFALSDKDAVWADDAARIYAEAASAQWDPADVDWSDPQLTPDVEAAVVQVMTYLIEGETAALLVPARFLGEIHPHFREIVQVLAVQAADEARHVEVFTRRATLRGNKLLGTSTAGEQASLVTLLDQRDFSLASFLLSVCGEGSLLCLLRFLAEHGDPVTAQISRLAAQDEARHVEFGLSHLQHHLSRDPGLLGRLAGAIRRRHSALEFCSGLNDDVFGSLVVLAAGAWDREALNRGAEAVGALVREMHDGRVARFKLLGFSAEDAAELSALHTRNWV